ncbi:unnamed protein product [Soboliphyme baturini]|uniref:Uncharacterized protein n=1 Tax=Soboliphyme baturini TaxID=241478 RepID=A0A183I9L9_9BILA|nr:unnamed protein product [Soboliphyme baturini]
MHMSRPSDLRYIELEEEEEMFRQQQQLHARNAAIERSWQRRRLAQQASLSSSGTADLGPSAGVVNDRYYSAATMADAGVSDGDGYESEIDRPNSVDGYSKRRSDARAVVSASGKIQPLFGVYQQRQPYGGGTGSEGASTPVVSMPNAHPYTVDFKFSGVSDDAYEKPLAQSGGRSGPIAPDRRRAVYGSEYNSSKVSCVDSDFVNREADSARMVMKTERAGFARRDSPSSEKSER